MMSEARLAKVAGQVEEASQQPCRALVMFAGVTDLRLLGFLRRGFRHCFVVLDRDNVGVLYDPLSNRTIIEVIRPFDLEAVRSAYRIQGYTVVDVVIQSPSAHNWLLRPCTCVEAVKQVLGMRAPRVVTPWQLFRRLRACRAKPFLALDTGPPKGILS